MILQMVQISQDCMVHGSEQYKNEVNSILANAPDPANTSVMVGYLRLDGLQGTNTRQKDN